MVVGIAIYKQNISMIVSGEEEKNLFIKIATVLDPNKIAKTLFEGEVFVEYLYLKSGDINIRLTNVLDFRYDELEKFIYHLLDHGVSIAQSIILDLFEQAQKLLDNGDIIFYYHNGHAQFNVRVEQGVVHVMPMDDVLNGSTLNLLFSHLETNSDLCRVKLGKRDVDIIPLLDIHIVVSTVVKIMLRLKMINSSESDSVINLIVRLALKDLAKNEVKNIRKVSLYPNDHPLSKYKGIALEAENIFNSLTRDEPLNAQFAEKLNKAINRQEEFSLAPQIIMRSFEKLRSHFHDEISALMSHKSN